MTEESDYEVFHFLGVVKASSEKEAREKAYVKFGVSATALILKEIAGKPKDASYRREAWSKRGINDG